MRYPTMGKSPRNAVLVPTLSGGVNLGDALNLVDDNQLTDCKNVWYKDGILQTRPGVEAVCQQDDIFRENVSGPTYYVNNKIELDGEKYKVEVFGDGNNYLKVWFFPEIYNQEKVTYVTTAKYIILSTHTDSKKPKNYVFYNGKSTKQNGTGVYMLTSYDDGTVALYEIINSSNSYSFALLTADELYAPVVYINGKGEGYEPIESSEATYAPASFFEGYSAITEAWASFYFTTDNKSMFYRLPIDIDNSLFKIEYTDLEGNVHDTIVYRIVDGVLNATAADNGTAVNGEIDNTNSDRHLGRLKIKGNTSKKFWVNCKTNSFCFLDKDGVLGSGVTDNALGVITNNLKFMFRPIAPKKSILAGATISGEFGGVAEGIYGGTRTFLSGFSGENKNLLVWSDLNNPTYFSENNYIYVGSKGQKITALAKQDDMFVIFKEKELFYSTYIQGNGYTADDVISGKVVDVTTLDAKFPVIQINDRIGCDLPDTVQLCGDRLVWASSDNMIYMLRSANQYSTANVRVISQMLGDRIKLSTSNATATTYNGFYMLKSGRNVYLLNYDYYYFNALPSYSDTKKAARKLQWFIWELPDIAETSSSFVGETKWPTLLVSSKFGGSSRHYVWLFKKENGEDEFYKPTIANNGLKDDYVTRESLIESVIQTKMFDFGAMERFKSIEQVYIGFGKSESEIALQYLTENGTTEEYGIQIAETKDVNSPEFIITKRFLPGIKRALKFGVRFTAKGKIAINDILIKFKYMGVFR